MSPRLVFINGRFLSQRVTGIQRYAREMLAELDGVVGARGNGAQWTVVVPRGVEVPQLRHIAVREVGSLNGHAWEQLELPWAVRGGVLLSFGSTGPFWFQPQVITVHDASVYRVPQAFSWKFRAWYKWVIGSIARRSRLTLSVSHFAASEVSRFFGAPSERVKVTSEGWQHLGRVTADRSILERHGLRQGSYFLAVSSRTPNKNFGLILQSSRLLKTKEAYFVVAGADNRKVFAGEQAESTDSVRYLGYVSDGELRALYENALCFVFPSRYEGFGIPPLEAMSFGCPVVASEIDAVREVCGEAACYFDPDDAVGLAALLDDLSLNEGRQRMLKEAGRRRLENYSWRRAAEATYEALTAAYPT